MILILYYLNRLFGVTSNGKGLLRPGLINFITEAIKKNMETGKSLKILNIANNRIPPCSSPLEHISPFHPVLCSDVSPALNSSKFTFKRKLKLTDVQILGDCDCKKYLPFLKDQSSREKLNLICRRCRGHSEISELLQVAAVSRLRLINYSALKDLYVYIYVYDLIISVIAPSDVNFTLRSNVK